MMRLQRMAQGDTTINITTVVAMWEAVRGRFQVKPVAARPWEGILSAREHVLMAISLGTLLWSLPVVNALILLGSAPVIYALGTSSWSNRRRLAVLFVILGAIIYGKFGVVRPNVGWARQGIEAFFILRCVDFGLGQHADAQGHSTADRLGRFILWIFFLPTLFLGPMASYGDFYRRYQPTALNRRQLILPALAKIAWGVCKMVLAHRVLRPLHEEILAAAMAGGASSGWPSLAEVDPRLLVAGSLALHLIAFYLAFSGMIDVVLGVSRWLGFNLPENFDKPLLSPNPVSYWKTSNISVYRWLMIHVFFRYWDHHRITAKVVTTFLISGLWHLMLLRMLSWDAVAQVGLAFAIFGASVAALVHLSHLWPHTRSVSTGPHPWVQRLCWGGKIALTFAFMAVIHGLFLNGLAGKPLGDTLAAYHVLCFGAQ
jgi:D-alanyl-lipoteichoic acid acyltransferase DltB (MBOAT superfamily)